MFSGKNTLRDADILSSKKDITKSGLNGYQYPLFSAKESEIEKEIQEMDINSITPIEALNKIMEWKKKI